MIAETVVELSRWQFAITALLHFLFIPLTLGLALLLALAESLHVFSGRMIYKAVAQFWGRIFAIGFVLAVTTRLTVIWQFGMNGSYFAHYVGDAFALPLAIEALSGFFLASALFAPYWLGWDKLGKYQHLTVTWLMVVAVHVSAYWVILANGWMQNPLGAAFNPHSYRMELIDFAQLLANPAVLTKFLHTAAAAYVTAMASVIAISAYWLRGNRDDRLARRSFNLAATLGLPAILMTVWLGDTTPYLDHPAQKAKLATITGAPATALLSDIESRIRSGMTAYARLQDLRDDNKDPQLLADFERHKSDLGYAWLLKPFSKQIVDAKAPSITAAAQSALPAYPALIFWSYRLMVVCGIGSLLLLLLAGWSALKQSNPPHWLLNSCLYLAPLPWLACIAGWFVAEAGKQPWAIAGVLPTFLGVSSLSTNDLLVSIAGYALIYTVVLGVGLMLMRQAIQSRRITSTGVES